MPRLSRTRVFSHTHPHSNPFSPLLLHLSIRAQPLIQDDELVLEASVYGWALDLPAHTEGAPGEKVGGNFGVPHRDNLYAKCHTEAGLPSILGIWIPCVETNTENGCMYVVPRERDDLFDKSDDKLHPAPHLIYQRSTDE